jgi:hypothetical protein
LTIQRVEATASSASCFLGSLLMAPARMLVRALPEEPAGTGPDRT